MASPQTDPQAAEKIGNDKMTASVVSTQPETTNAAKPRNAATGLSRVGVQTAQPLTLSLQEAIRRALESNNDIEVSRGDVRYQETQVRSLLGVYDPVFSVSPNYSRSNTTGQPATNDFRINSSFSHNIQRGGGNYPCQEAAQAPYFHPVLVLILLNLCSEISRSTASVIR